MHRRAGMCRHVKAFAISNAFLRGNIPTVKFRRLSQTEHLLKSKRNSTLHLIAARIYGHHSREKSPCTVNAIGDVDMYRNANIAASKVHKFGKIFRALLLFKFLLFSQQSTYAGIISRWRIDWTNSIASYIRVTHAWEIESSTWWRIALSTCRSACRPAETG